jgi:hypothetical protein
VVRFLVWAILAVLKPRALLVAENLCLQQQLLMLQRRCPQPRLRNADRQFFPVGSSPVGWRTNTGVAVAGFVKDKASGP